VATVTLVAPDSWSVTPVEHRVQLGAHEDAVVRFELVPDAPAERARVAADLTVGEARFGQQAEALVDVR
jgi:hypothetical protein